MKYKDVEPKRITQQVVEAVTARLETRLADTGGDRAAAVALAGKVDKVRLERAPPQDARLQALTCTWHHNTSFLHPDPCPPAPFLKR